MEGSDRKDTKKGAAALREERASEKQAARDADRESLLEKAVAQAGEPVRDREKEKQASRDADRADLLSGRKSPAELYRENSHFAGLRVEVDYRGCKDLSAGPLHLGDLVRRCSPSYGGPQGRVVAISYGAAAPLDGAADSGFGDVGESIENPYYCVLFDDGQRAGLFGDDVYLVQSASDEQGPDEAASPVESPSDQ